MGMAERFAFSRVPTAHSATTLRSKLRRRGREISLEEIYRDHHQEIYRYCLAIVRNPADAEDAMQATMAAALRTLPDEERKIAIRPWLFRVAHNESISIIRTRRETPTAAETELDTTVQSAAEDLEDQEQLRTLVTDLQALPDRQRSALVMRELSGLSYAEIAASLDCAEGSARQVVYEARSALQTRVEGRAMDCAEARIAIDAGDRRRLRGRMLKAHLASCEACSDFKLAIEMRRENLQAICPPLPLAAAGGILAALTGGGVSSVAGGGATALAGGGTAAGIGIGGSALGAGTAASAMVKGASIVAGTVLAVGAADATDVIDLPGPLDRGGSGTTESIPAEPASGTPTTGAEGRPGSDQAQEARAQGVAASTKKGENGKDGKHGGKDSKGGKGSEKSQGQAQSQNNAGGNPSAPGGGKSQLPPQAAGGSPQPGPPSAAITPGNSNGGAAGTSPGRGQDKSPPANQPSHSNAGGKSRDTP